MITVRIRTSLLFLLMFLFIQIQAQDTLKLQGCYDLLKQNYPLIKQKDLINQSNDLSMENIRKAYLPQFNLSAQATYQSDVTSVPVKLPNSTILPPNKDQYKATLNLNQVIYDGGLVSSSTAIQDMNTKIQLEQLETSVYQLKSKINQWYFAILLLQEKKNLLLSVKENLETRYKELKSAVENGVAISSTTDVMYAEILKTKQQLFELEEDRKASVDMLSLFIGKSITSNTVIKNPTMEIELENKIKRPEMLVFNLQKNQLDASSNLLSKKNIPKLFFFAQGGYGNPGLNMLDNSFQAFYLGGVKLNWDFWDWNITKRQRQMLDINKSIISNQQEVFELNTNVTLLQLKSEIEKFNQLLKTDDEIISLRKSIVQASEAQLQKGIITTSQYLVEVTALKEVEINKKTHEIQLLITKANYRLTQGSPEN